MPYLGPAELSSTPDSNTPDLDNEGFQENLNIRDWCFGFELSRVADLQDKSCVPFQGLRPSEAAGLDTSGLKERTT